MNTHPILVQVNGIWRRVKRVAEHPAGAMYVLYPRPEHPGAVAVAKVTRSLSRLEGGAPALTPAFAS